jgi:hypothetical protein
VEGGVNIQKGRDKNKKTGKIYVYNVLYNIARIEVWA